MLHSFFMNPDQKVQSIYLGELVIVVASIFGSLFFSEVMKFPPCNLCWYQRICVYPMAPIILTGLYLKSKETVYFLLPFSFVGLAIAVYHNLVYYKVVSVIVPCTESAPCTAQQLNMFGFVTIPLLSALTFLLLTIMNLYIFYGMKKEGN